MSVRTITAGVDCEALADLDMLMRHPADKTPLDPELTRRVEERADRIIEALRQKCDLIDVDKLLQDTRAEQ